MKSRTSDTRHPKRLPPSMPFQPPSTKTTSSRNTDRFGKDSNRRKPLRDGFVRSAMLVAAALAFGGGLAHGPANAGETPPDPSDYCRQLADQFDQTLLTSPPSRYLIEAGIRRENGWTQCNQGKVSQGEHSLKGALRDLGATPEPRSRRPLL